MTANEYVGGLPRTRSGVYGFDGELLAEYPQTGPSVAVAQPQKEYGYRNGQLLVTAEPYANAAWNQPATQTDDFSATTTAGKATDGDVDGDVDVGHASATNSHANSWWQTDLQSVQTISSITVWGRTDCCPEMTSDFYVFVSDNPFTATDLTTTLNQSGVSNYLHSGFSGPGSTSAPTSINVNRTGRYVRVQLAGTNSLALGEVQVWSQAAKLEWLVTDQLGTPRMIVDKTGTLAGVSRHDYLPFGEEISAGTGGRTTTQGYSAADGLRQKFTLKERDNETGLDYFGARYYASMQGRFTSPDRAFADQFQSNPQSWNTYSYVRNSPCNNVDAKGRCSAPSGLKPGQVGICIESFIATRTFKKVGLGDSRDFSGDNEKLTARVTTDVIASRSPVNPQKIDISQTTKASMSTLLVPTVPGPRGVLASFQGTAQTALDGAKGQEGAETTSAITKSIDQDGLARVNVSTHAESTFSGAGDFGSIRSSLNFTININTGEVKRDQNSQVSGYPSIAAYSYSYQGNKVVTTTLLENKEGPPDDLKQPMKPLPDPPQ